jgi:guanylate kinase
MPNNNGTHYFETLNRFQGELTEDALVQRMNECNMVLGELSKSEVWKIVLNDARGMIKMLDDNWQNLLPNTDKFQEARVIKIACKQISDLPGKYLEELTMIQDKLKEIQNPDKIVEKDNDNN